MIAVTPVLGEATQDRRAGDSRQSAGSLQVAARIDTDASRIARHRLSSGGPHHQTFRPEGQYVRQAPLSQLSLALTSPIRSSPS